MSDDQQQASKTDQQQTSTSYGDKLKNAYLQNENEKKERRKKIADTYCDEYVEKIDNVLSSLTENQQKVGYLGNVTSVKLVEEDYLGKCDALEIAGKKVQMKHNIQIVFDRTPRVSNSTFACQTGAWWTPGAVDIATRENQKNA